MVLGAPRLAQSSPEKPLGQGECEHTHTHTTPASQGCILGLSAPWLCHRDEREAPLIQIHGVWGYGSQGGLLLPSTSVSTWYRTSASVCSTTAPQPMSLICRGKHSQLHSCTRRDHTAQGCFPPPNSNGRGETPSVVLNNNSAPLLTNEANTGTNLSRGTR